MKRIDKFYVLYHPEFGYVTFDKRSCEARITEDPNPRGLYSKRHQAEARQKDPVWVKGAKRPGSELEIREIDIYWCNSSSVVVE